MQEEKNFFQRNVKWIVVLGVAVLLVFWALGNYNNFVSQNESINSQWAQVDNQLQRRFDLIPNLVETVKGVAKQETSVFTAIADARTRYSGATNLNDKAKAASDYESAIGRLLVITENYPVLQSSQAYRDLMTSLEGTENRLSTERKKYNDLVQLYNAKVKMFPSMITAKLFGFGEKSYFEVKDSAKENPEVKF